MNQNQVREENRIHAALSACNPLNNEDFCDDVRKSYLECEHDDLPQAVSDARLIAGLWKEAMQENSFVTRTAMSLTRTEPIFNAILAEGLSAIEQDQQPDLTGAGSLAQQVMVDLLRKRVEEVGVPATMDELRREYLLALEQMAESGFSGGSVFMLAYIAGIGQLARKVSQVL